MNTPNRSGLVMQICNAHPEVFNVPPEQNDPSRLAFLKSTLLPALIALDGNWGYLVKTNQGNKVPVDIIVWKDTMEHFDVMTGTGGVWIPHGPINNPAWIWSQEGLQSTPIPSPIPNPPPPSSDGVLQAITELNSKLDVIISNQQAMMAVLSQMARINGDTSDRLTTATIALTTLIGKKAPDYKTSVFGATVVLHPTS